MIYPDPVINPLWCPIQSYYRTTFILTFLFALNGPTWSTSKQDKPRVVRVHRLYSKILFYSLPTTVASVVIMKSIYSWLNLLEPCVTSGDQFTKINWQELAPDLSQFHVEIKKWELLMYTLNLCHNSSRWSFLAGGVKGTIGNSVSAHLAVSIRTIQPCSK